MHFDHIAIVVRRTRPDKARSMWYEACEAGPEGLKAMADNPAIACTLATPEVTSTPAAAAASDVPQAIH